MVNRLESKSIQVGDLVELAEYSRFIVYSGGGDRNADEGDIFIVVNIYEDKYENKLVVDLFDINAGLIAPQFTLDSVEYGFKRID